MDVLIIAQKNEITEHHIYGILAAKSKDEENKKTLERLSKDELKHYNILKKHTKRDLLPNRFKILLYSLLAVIFGISFTVRLMEKGEKYAQKLYENKKEKDFEILFKDEQRHERSLIDILKDYRVEYAGSIVLGLNDALVELTGALAGLSLAIAHGKLIAIIGGITGFAAAMSMAASSYLSSKEDKSHKDAIRGSTYTGIAYIITVALLIMPFILIDNVFISMIIMLCTTVLIISFYTFYMSIAKNTKFWPKFFEMALISLGVAAISFVVGWLVRIYIGVDG